MTSLQRCRVRFYRCVLRMTRLLGGEVLVAQVPSSTATAGDPAPSADDDVDIGGILLWMPPSKRLSGLGLLTLWQSGFFGLVAPWNYGLTGLYRIEAVFEANTHAMFAKTLPENQRDCALVQMIAINPKYAGKGYASALLKYRIEQHFKELPDRPVILDTSTVYGVRAYEKLGFKLLAQMPVDTGTDATGIKLKANPDSEIVRLAKETCIQRVLVRYH